MSIHVVTENSPDQSITRSELSEILAGAVADNPGDLAEILHVTIRHILASSNCPSEVVDALDTLIHYERILRRVISKEQTHEAGIAQLRSDKPSVASPKMRSQDSPAKRLVEYVRAEGSSYVGDMLADVVTEVEHIRTGGASYTSEELLGRYNLDSQMGTA